MRYVLLIYERERHACMTERGHGSIMRAVANAAACRQHAANAMDIEYSYI